MRWFVPLSSGLLFALVIVLLAGISTPISAQSTALIEGLVVDPHGAVVEGVKITAMNPAIGFERETTSDACGRYSLAALPIGDYVLRASAAGFKRQVVEKLTLEVSRRITHDFQLEPGDISEQVTITSANDVIDRAMAVGHVIDSRTVRQLPLNGRYFLDFALLVPGSVTPPQGAFSASPARGLGSLAINTAGNREETVNYQINGITLNNLTFSSISFQPSINTIQEFKTENSTFSAEYGGSAGAVVNIATRSGGNSLHGQLFEFFRNDALDARNFFELTSSEPAPFKRNQFGGNIGGSIVRDKLFFFVSYEGLRQRQALNLNSLVLSDSQRALVSDPVVTELIALIPRPNLIDSSGTARFVSAASAPVNVDQWTADIGYNLSERDRLHGYYAIQNSKSSEPNRFGNTIPGFGHVASALRQIFTFNETHTFSQSLVNELRLGFNRFSSTSTPLAQLNPAAFGIKNGINEPVGLPQINIAGGGGLNFGGPANQPSGRGDNTFVAADTMSWLTGRHSLRIGGEYRQFLNNNFRQSTGSFNFPSVAAFVAGVANSSSVTLGNQSSSIAQGALGFFVQDSYRLNPRLNFELGLRYDWNMTPSERYDRFIVFDPQTNSLLRIGSDIDKVYEENNRNFQPRVGFAWQPFAEDKMVVRGAYGVYVDQPMTSIVTGLAGNPPLAIPLTFSGAIHLDDAINVAGPAGLAPVSIDHDFDNAYVQSWNLNVQRELFNTVLMLGYLGSKGRQLITRRNINQPVNGARPFPALSPSSPILPGAALGNITEVGSSGNSSYNALWFTATRRLTRGWQFDASYTWSKSIDYTSFSTGGILVQNSYDLRGERGVSDFDARHRFVLSSIYELPFDGDRLVSGWRLAVIVQSQSGNPVNVVTTNSTVNGVSNTLRPDVEGPINVFGDVDKWFDTSVFAAVPRFGNLGRNVIVGPSFNNTDVALIKDTTIGEELRLQLRAEVFDVFNHANFGRPGNSAGTPSFGRISSTRFPTGESGSSRQIQFAVKFEF